MTTRDTDPAVPGFDPAVAHPARVYNVWLGGKDHFAPDREAAQRVVECRPQVVAGARANRQFLGRVVRYLAGKRGISQFLDIGTGLPAPDNTHEVAQALNPAARIVYAALAATRRSAQQFDLYPLPGVRSELATKSARCSPADPDPGPEPEPDRQPPDPDESLQRMLVITGLLTAAGLTACLTVTRDIPDVTAWLPQPGGRDIKIIIDDDGYVELRFWVSPDATPERVTTVVTGTIAGLTASG